MEIIQDGTVTLRRAPAARMTAVNPALAIDELGIEIDTGRMKIGPGNWNALQYVDNPNRLAVDAAFTSRFTPLAFAPTGTIAATETHAAIAEVAADALSLAARPPTDAAANEVWGLPGVTPTVAVTTVVLAAGALAYFPVEVDNQTGITLDRVRAEITTAAAATNTVRLVIASADGSWQPTALVLDAGTRAADALAVVEWGSLAQNLARGRYLFALYPTANTTFRCWPANPPGGPWFTTALGANPYIILASRSTGAPASVPNYNALVTGNSPGLRYPIAARWSVNP
jgi:hypothetical protein